ncbi:MAG: MBL fold metallo-hydrolase [Bacteroidota bacterium]|nr:MBL fold metallo-hydrolase [Bacteroidota bacterium]
MAILKTFGNNPAGNDLQTIKGSLNYRDGVFQNLSRTEALVKGASFLKIMWRYFTKPGNTKPPVALPSVMTNINLLKEEKPVILWFGHSSYFIQCNGKNILVDPVFCGYASPFSFTGKSFKGADIYSAEDFPDIDMLILTHDHYDHLDYKTVLKLQPKTKKICTSLGVGSHLKYWGIDPAKIVEFDWWDSQQVTEGDPAGPIELTAAPARHFSGRLFTRNKTLWSSFILKSGNYRIYIGADSGYDSHFKMIGEKYGPFDIAMLESGQYNEYWPYIHMMPEETVQAAADLKAKVLLPVHWGKFAISLHPWDEPIKRVIAKASELNVKVTTPMIGEPVILDSSYPRQQWWLTVA